MAAVRNPSSFVTPAEYLEFDRSSIEKYEYVNGVIYPRNCPPGCEIVGMAGAKPSHNHVTSDAQFAFSTALRSQGSPCEVESSEFKVRALDGGPFFYPDFSIVCDEPWIDDDYCLRNPILIAEVLSPSTADYDRGEKFLRYRRIRSLRHYLLIEQDRIYVEHHERLESGIWGLVGEYVRRNEVLTIPDLQISVALSEIYRRVPEAPDTDVAD